MRFFGKMILMLTVPPKTMKDKRRRNFSYNIDEVEITYDEQRSEYATTSGYSAMHPFTPRFNARFPFMETSGTITARFGPTPSKTVKKPKLLLLGAPPKKGKKKSK